MKYFTASGLWFLGDDPENRVAGTLRYSEHGLHLKLMGGFRGGWSPRSEPYPVIHGVVGKNPYGEYVTLIDCFTKRTKLSSAGIGSETIYCTRGIAGESHLPPNHDEYEALDLKLTYLKEWFGRRAVESQIVPGERFAMDIRYRSPESVRYSIGGESLTLGASAKTRESVYDFNITQEVQFYIKPLPRCTADKLHDVYVRPLQNLLSFATDTPNAVDEIRLRGDKVRLGGAEWSRKYHFIYNPIFRLKGRKKHLIPGDMLFTFDEAADAGLNIFENWLGFTSRHEAFCTIYFASLYGPSRYLDEKFVRLMSAFTLLSTSLGGGSQRTNQFSEEIDTLSGNRFTVEERALLGHVLPTGPEIEMPFHLLRLLEENRPIMSQVIGEDFSVFVKSVSETMAYVERRSVAGGRPPLWDMAMHYAMEKLRILIKIIMLKELGFGDEQVSGLIERNKRFIYLKGMDT